MTKHHGVLIGIAIVFALICGLISEVAHRRQLAPFEVKAKKFDEVCSLVKASLRTDRSLLKTDTERKLLFSRFAENYIGDSYQMLEWCVPHAKEFVEEFRRCGIAGDYACVDQVLRRMMESVDVL